MTDTLHLLLGAEQMLRTIRAFPDPEQDDEGAIDYWETGARELRDSLTDEERAEYARLTAPLELVQTSYDVSGCSWTLPVEVLAYDASASAEAEGRVRECIGRTCGDRGAEAFRALSLNWTETGDGSATCSPEHGWITVAAYERPSA